MRTRSGSVNEKSDFCHCFFVSTSNSLPSSPKTGHVTGLRLLFRSRVSREVFVNKRVHLEAVEEEEDICDI